MEDSYKEGSVNIILGTSNFTFNAIRNISNPYGRFVDNYENGASNFWAIEQNEEFGIYFDLSFARMFDNL